MKDIALVGAGNVASHLAKALKDRIQIVVSRNGEHARELACEIGAQHSDSFAALRHLRPDIVLISIADKAINDVVAAIGKLDYHPLVLHTSGTVAMEALKPMSDRVGVLYPLQTFSKGTHVNIREVPFFTEVSAEADYEIVDSLAQELSDNVQHANAEHRRKLHIAGVFTSNFTNVLLESVQKVLEPEGYTLDVVKPLIELSVSKAFAIGPHAAQTGPARRGDTAVMARQEAALPDYLKPVYRELSKLIIEYHK